jgi:anti-sigma factor RsiW
MKPRCREIEALFAPYVDDEAAAPDRATVDAHLHACGPCRDRVASERVAREVLRSRRTGLRPCASDALRTRCAAHRIVPAIKGGLVTRRGWVPLSLAAALLLAIGGTLFLAGNTVEVLAAQLAVDHIKCFQFPPDRAAVDPLAEGRKWEAGHGWPLKVTASEKSEQLELIGVRRCLSTEGRVAHLMYRWRGQPLSVFVLNSRLRRSDDSPGTLAESSLENMGEHAIIWSRAGRTYAVVARDSSPRLQEVARYVRRASE